MGPLKKTILYALFVIAVTVLFLYALFPSEQIKPYIISMAEQYAPGIQVAIEKISPAFPPGIKLQQIDIRHKEYTLLKVDSARVAPSLWSLLKLRKTINFNLVTSQGKIRGQAQLTPPDENMQMVVQAELMKIQLKQVALLRGLPDYIVSGELDGRIEYQVDHDNRGRGVATIGVSQGSLELLKPVMSIDKLEFRNIDAELSLSPGQVRFRRCDMDGREVDGRLIGSILLSSPYENSRMNLSGTAKPHPEFLNKIRKSVPLDLFGGKDINRSGLPFRIYGTFNKPGFALR